MDIVSAIGCSVCPDSTSVHYTSPSNSQDDHEVLSAGWSPCGLPRFVTEREADYVIAEAEVMVQAGEDSPAALAAARLKAESRVLAFIQEELAADACVSWGCPWWKVWTTTSPFCLLRSTLSITPSSDSDGGAWEGT